MLTNINIYTFVTFLPDIAAMFAVIGTVVFVCLCRYHKQGNLLSNTVRLWSLLLIGIGAILITILFIDLYAALSLYTKIHH